MKVVEKVSELENPDVLVSEQVFSKLIGMSYAWVKQHRLARKLNVPYVKIGVSVRYRKSEIEKFINANTIN